jgi:hypothetical protein
MQSPSWQANSSSANQEIPRILWNLRFITALTRARHLSLSWAWDSLSYQRTSPSPRHCEVFRNILSFYGEELLAPRPISKLEDHPL